MKGTTMKDQNSTIPSKEQSKKNSDHHTLKWLIFVMLFGFISIYSFFIKDLTVVVAKGKIVSQNYDKIIEHPKGGFVAKLYVKEGEFVKKDTPLIVLDHTETDKQLQTAINEYDEYFIKKVRYEAEAKLSRTVDFQDIKNKFMDKSRADALIAKERKLFETEKKLLKAKIRSIKDQNHALEEKIQGLQQVVLSDHHQLQSYKEELAKYKKLYKKNMVSQLVIFDLERKINKFEASIAKAQSQIDEASKKIQANNSLIKFYKLEYIHRAQEEVKKIGIKLVALRSKIEALRHINELAILKAPEDGIVMDMRVHAIGEVVDPHQPIMTIASTQFVMVEAYIQPIDIDKVQIGQKASILFPTYAVHSHVPIEGKIVYISPDVLPKKNLYKILVEITGKGMETIKKNNMHIVPGLQPAVVYINTYKH
ncbi:Type I secretion membrane fusion protein, HlyD family [Dissulfuribacter thermophilus]|uniref:Type I secretion membrane fusion protein, HlyD family n=1 Tax=Dissulfuribacter thermophilus TaxID=1156395 RepID=A0A1B9F322_9BACT|nr:HlyD family type I secretion periplasmic adaptor subunit [Dissulfuribacter thermophilus]OCC14339.1 Type I secretion membrane fusion protein, HlyD family [Dissulfuribacter thermophilus]